MKMKYWYVSVTTTTKTVRTIVASSAKDAKELAEWGDLGIGDRARETIVKVVKTVEAKDLVE